MKGYNYLVKVITAISVKTGSKAGYVIETLLFLGLKNLPLINL